MGDTPTTYKHTITLRHDSERREIVYTLVKFSRWTQEMIWADEILPLINPAGSLFSRSAEWRIVGFEVEKKIGAWDWDLDEEKEFSVRVKGDPADHTNEP